MGNPQRVRRTYIIRVVVAVVSFSCEKKKREDHPYFTTIITRTRCVRSVRQSCSRISLYDEHTAPSHSGLLEVSVHTSAWPATRADTMGLIWQWSVFSEKGRCGGGDDWSNVGITHAAVARGIPTYTRSICARVCVCVCLG